MTRPIGSDATAPVNVVLIGPPGCGKGTQAVRLAERYRVPHISTGEILRSAVRAGTGLGRQVADTLTKGSLVGDDLMADLVSARLAEPDTKRGFVLDGFPRTVGQARALDDLLGPAVMLVILIHADDAEIVRRMGTRRVCDSCRVIIGPCRSQSALWQGAAVAGGGRGAGLGTGVMLTCPF